MKYVLNYIYLLSLNFKVFEFKSIKENKSIFYILNPLIVQLTDTIKQPDLTFIIS